MKFDTYEEQWDFVRKYATISCLNCDYGPKEDDKPSRSFLCRHSIVMASLDNGVVCVEWKRGSETMKDYLDEPVWKLTAEEMEALENESEGTD